MDLSPSRRMSTAGMAATMLSGVTVPPLLLGVMVLAAALGVRVGANDPPAYYSQGEAFAWGGDGGGGGAADVDGGDVRYDLGAEGGYISDWQNSEWAGGPSDRINQGKCIAIPSNLTLCKGIGYEQMRLPNLLDHDTVREVTQQAASWVPLLGIRCHPDTKLFLCSLFSPVCLDRPIWPCRTLCQAVKNGCEGRMMKYGFPWPEMLRCDKFPLDNDLCIGLQHDNKPDDTVCDACNQPDTFEAIMDNFCGAEFALRVEVSEYVVSGGDMKLVTTRKKKKLKKGDIKKRELRGLVLHIAGGAKCDCRYLGQDRNAHKKFVVMGNRVGDKLVVQYLVRDEKGSVDLKKALRQIRKSDAACDAGLQNMGVGSSGNNAAARRESPSASRGVGKQGGGRDRNGERRAEEAGGGRDGDNGNGNGNSNGGGERKHSRHQGQLLNQQPSELGNPHASSPATTISTTTTNAATTPAAAADTTEKSSGGRRGSRKRGERKKDGGRRKCKNEKKCKDKAPKSKSKKNSDRGRRRSSLESLFI